MAIDELIIFPTDALLFLLLFLAVSYFIYARFHEHLTAPWRQVLSKKSAMISALIFIFFITIGYLDSIHFRVAADLKADGSAQTAEIESLLDRLLQPLPTLVEKSYSAPFALNLFARETKMLTNGRYQQYYPALQNVNKQVQKGERSLSVDIEERLLTALWDTCLVFATLILIMMSYLRIVRRQTLRTCLYQLYRTPAHGLPRLAFFATLFSLLFVTFICVHLFPAYHILGTDQIGQDVFYLSLKSVRTGLVIGTLTTLVMLPFALLLGTLAGYFLGWIDDLIQYIYTTLSSIPGVLLISASVLAMQIFFTNHEHFFSNTEERADARLLMLCIILGITSWTSLCRILRGETLKLREMEYIQAAVTFGVKNLAILWRHILPNVFHIVIISVVLDFSGLVLAEAVLSYVGVGVDPLTYSFGNMINAARLELAREPAVWWPLLAAFVFMFAFVLAANVLSDSVRAAFDPRQRRG